MLCPNCGTEMVYLKLFSDEVDIENLENNNIIGKYSCFKCLFSIDSLYNNNIECNKNE